MYGQTAGVSAGVIGTGGVAAAGTLPFTGSSTVWFILAGLTLISTGIASRRLVRQ